MDAGAASLWSSLTATLNSGVALSMIAVVWTMVWQNLPHFPLQDLLRRQLNRRARRLAAAVDPYLSVRIEEFEGGRMKCSAAFEEVKAYLTTATADTDDVRHLRAECARDTDRLVLSMVDGQEVTDAFEGATVWWSARSFPPPSDFAPWRRAAHAERRFYQLFFHHRHRDLILNDYLPHVRRQGRAVMVQNRQLKIFSNIPREGWSWEEDGHYKKSWTHVPFEHPKTFDTLAMDPAKKQEIIDDLDAFKKGKEYYKRVGKAWKRGYLLHGPPGTGKSTMIAAMANYLEYDIYDVELTTVKTNTDLRRLLIETTNKSIMVFEDIDCSLDLAGKRGEKKKKKKKGKGKEEEESEDGLPKGPEQDDGGSRVTLSGLLNFIDGLWSACGEERLIVLTTNHVEKLDPALIRTGRMDKHIEMSYCDFESFKFLSRTHLGDDVDMAAQHEELVGAVRQLLEEVKMVPAAVGEHLTPKTAMGGDAVAAAGSCLANLVKALQKAKEEAIQKAKEEALQKAEEELEKEADEDEEQKGKAEDEKGGKGQEDEQVAKKG